MTRARLCFAVLLATGVLSPAARAVPPMPDDKRIPAAITSTLSAPTTQPMHMPTDVAIDSKGRAYVADGSHDRLLLFASNGSFQSSIPQFADQKLNRPVGLTIDSADRLWIADTGNHRLLLISPEGSLLQRIPLPPTDKQRACDPTGLAVTPDRSRTYLVDNDGNRVLIRDNATGNWTPMGSAGRRLGQFEWPFMITIGGEGYVFVTETIGSRVQIISPTDRWAGTIGSWGIEIGQLFRPKGITADAAGKIYVSDSTLGVVQVFGPRGAIEGVLTDDDGQPLRFAHPMGLRFGPDKRLYVVELRANRVAVVTLKPRGGR